jgi:predicted nucleotidyltransferase
MHEEDIQKQQIAEDLSSIVEYFRAFPSVRRVWLFGRAAKGGKLDFRSDLDIAVEGLPPAAHFGTVSKLNTSGHFPVDVVLWEEADEVLRSEILKWGRIIYEAGA